VRTLAGATKIEIPMTRRVGALQDESSLSGCDRMAGQGSSHSVDLDGTIVELAPRLLRYAVARLGDVSLAEEIAQESLAALVRHWRHSGPPSSAEAFVFAIARRRIGRAVWRRRLSVPLEEVFGARDDHPDPEAQAISRAEEDRVRAALARLPRRDREALLLVAVGELTMADTAAALGVSVSAVKMRVHRARGRLSALLGERHEERLTA
jgi:RNA polymerase sigma-70 factor, ECF subfamily